MYLDAWNECDYYFGKKYIYFLLLHTYTHKIYLFKNTEQNNKIFNFLEQKNIDFSYLKKKEAKTLNNES